MQRSSIANPRGDSWDPLTARQLLTSPLLRHDGVNYRKWWPPCVQDGQLIWPDCLPSPNGLCGQTPWDIKYVQVNWGRLENRPAFIAGSNSHTSPSCSSKRLKMINTQIIFLKCFPQKSISAISSPAKHNLSNLKKDSLLQTRICIRFHLQFISI